MSVYGITTVRAHLDRLEVVPMAEGQAGTTLADIAAEIDWNALVAWMNSIYGAGDAWPAFAGRYFRGTATQAEVDAGATPGTGFCLWAHGEAADAITRKIVPLQRADPARQSAIGELARNYAKTDALGLALYLDLCLEVGDLSIEDTAQILVFLEVADGTHMSREYWTAWATTIYESVLHPRGGNPVQPLVPGILCAFVFDTQTTTYLPELAIRQCLDSGAPRGYRSRCYGFWARKSPGDPGLTLRAFSWSNIGTYAQPREFLVSYTQRVPVRYLRFDPPPVPPAHAAVNPTLALLTLDWPASGGDDPTGATFTATGWRLDRRNESQRLIVMPTQLGLDTSERMAEEVACVMRTEVVVRRLAYYGAGTPVDLRQRCDFAIRYYSDTGTKIMSLAEAQALSAHGLQIVACWQRMARTEQGDAVYAADIVKPFTRFEGQADAVTAFTYAADTIGQPPYTPIYFSVDFPAGDPNYVTSAEAPAGWHTPGIDLIVRYFQDVNRGYRTYLQTHPTKPYYIGVYAYPDICAKLYRAGLASYFWQPPWGTGSPFPHLNAWQVGMFNSAGLGDDNATLRACHPLEGGVFWLDIDVAWGNPGGFQVPVP